MSTIRVGNIGPLTGNTSTIADPGVSGGGMSLVSMGPVSASGTSVDFTGIPSWARRITVLFDSISTNGSTDILFQLGTSSGVDTGGTTSYIASSGYFGAGTSVAATDSNGFRMRWSSVAADIHSGIATVTLVGNNSWIFSCDWAHHGYLTYSQKITGKKTLASVLDRVRVTTMSGTATFDAGTINCMYE